MLGIKILYPLVDKAKYLLSLNCAQKECVTAGQIRFAYAGNAYNQLFMINAIYHFHYYFQEVDKSCNNK